MKLKKLLIPAVLLFLVGGAAKICDTVFNTLGEGFFLSSQACNLTLAAAFLVLYVLAFALSIADRKKSFKTVPTKSMICGIFGFIASVALIGGSVVRILSGGTDNLVESITGIIAGFLLLYESCISFTGMNGMRKMPVAALILPVWGCIRFIMLFIDYTQKSLKATELFDIVAIGFMVMFLFYQSMFFAGINNRLAVRKAVVYGSVFIMLGLIVSVDLIIKMASGKAPLPNIDTQIVEPTILNIITIVGDLAMCCYAFFLLRSMLKNAEDNLTLPDDNLNDDIILTEDYDKPVPDTPKAVAPSDVPADAPADIPAVAPSDAPAVAPADVPAVAPAVAPADAPAVPEVPVNGKSADTKVTAAVYEEENKTAPTQANKAVKPVQPVKSAEAALPKVEEPARSGVGDDSGAYDELFKMLDEIK